MSDTSAQAATDAAAQAAAAATQTATQQTQAAATTTTQTDVKSLPDWAQALISDTRNEAATHRTKLRETEEKLKGFETAQLTEAEKLQKRAADAEAAAQQAQASQKETLTRLEIERQARKLNIVDEDAAFRLLDQSKIEFNDGAPTNIKALVSALVAAKPYLVQQAGAGAPGNPATQHGGITLEKLKTMTREQIAAIPEKDLDAILAARR